MDAQTGRFVDDAARSAFLGALDAELSDWPDREDRLIDTAFGPTMVSRVAGHGAGDPVVLLQGGGSSIAIWRPYVEAWRDDRDVIAIDTVWEAGRSEHRAPVRDGADAAAWLEAVLDGAEVDHAHLVGYSYGGWIALEQACRSQERLRSVTAIEPAGALAALPIAAWWRMLRMLLGDDDRHREYLAWVRGGKLPDSTTLELLTASHRGFRSRGTPRPTRLTTAQWQSIHVPLTIMLGARSRLVPTRRAARTVRDHAPDADLHVLESAGHALLVDEPQAVIDAVRALTARHDRRPTTDVHDA